MGMSINVNQEMPIRGLKWEAMDVVFLVTAIMELRAV